MFFLNKWAKYAQKNQAKLHFFPDFAEVLEVSIVWQLEARYQRLAIGAKSLHQTLLC